VAKAVVLSAVRTPIGRYGGALAGVRPDDLAAVVIREAVARANVPTEQIEDVWFGAANQAGEDNRNVARMAALLAGLPESAAGVTVNRLCASGLAAVIGAIGTGLIACALLMANNVRDIPTDTAAGKRTLAVRLGDRHARESYVLMLAVSILLVIVLAPTKPWMLIVLLLIPACLMPAWLMVNGKKRKSLIPVLKQTGLINLGYSLLFSLGLILSRGF